MRRRPPDLKERATTLVGAPLGGTVRAVVRHEPVTAWVARTPAGQDAVYEQLDGGRPTLLYRETRPGVHLTALAPLDGGRVAVVALRSAGGARRASVLLVTPGVPQPAGARGLGALARRGRPTAPRSRASARAWRSGGASAPSAGSPTRSSSSTCCAGRTRVVASARLRTARLSDPSLGYGRVVWSSAVIAGSRLVRSSVLADSGVTDIARWCARSSLEVAHDLIGCELLIDGVGGRIVECEAYRRDDPASHSLSRADAAQCDVMFGPAGRVYVYLSYGLHWMLNIVCGAQEGAGEAVLIRALEPTTGLEQMRERRGREDVLDLCRGPGRLGQALAVGPDAGRRADRRRPRRADGRGSVRRRRADAAHRHQPRAGTALAVPARGLALRQSVPSLTISVTSAPFAASLSGIGYCE